jgi:hypothetical protein
MVVTEQYWIKRSRETDRERERKDSMKSNETKEKGISKVELYFVLFVKNSISINQTVNYFFAVVCVCTPSLDNTFSRIVIFSKLFKACKLT